MDQVLRDRYTILVADYPVDNQTLRGIRDEVLKNLYEGHRQLRPDAALILVTLFDQMIIRPYHGQLHGPYFYPDWKYGHSFPLPNKFRDMKESDFLDRCMKSLHVILSGAQKQIDKDKTTKDDDSAVSSHAILRSINDNWSFLAESFGWA